MENISSVKHEFVEQKILTIPIKKRKKGYGEKRNKYVKISLKKRKILLDKVFFENKNIKKAAQELEINYSSAKTILYLYRKNIQKKAKANNDKRCNFKFITEDNGKGIHLEISHGGKNIKIYDFIEKSDYVNFNFFHESTIEILSNSTYEQPCNSFSNIQ